MESQSNVASPKAFEERTKVCSSDRPIGLFVDQRKNLYSAYGDTVAYEWFKSNPYKHSRWHVLTARGYLHADDIAKAVAEFMPK